MLAKVAAGLLGTVALAGAYVVQEGAVRIAVDQRPAGEKHIRLLLPAALVPLGLKFVPDEKLREAVAQARPWLPAVRAASQELGRLPDADLLEVQDTRDHVRLSKRGRLLVLDVESTCETVHISFPVKTLEQVAQRLASLGPLS